MLGTGSRTVVGPKPLNFFLPPLRLHLWTPREHSFPYEVNVDCENRPTPHTDRDLNYRPPRLSESGGKTSSSRSKSDRTWSGRRVVRTEGGVVVTEGRRRSVVPGVGSVWTPNVTQYDCPAPVLGQRVVSLMLRRVGSPERSLTVSAEGSRDQLGYTYIYVK